jgi:hypothetical protein
VIPIHRWLLQTESRRRFPESLSPVFPHQVFDVDRERSLNPILAFSEDWIKGMRGPWRAQQTIKGDSLRTFSFGAENSVEIFHSLYPAISSVVNLDSLFPRPFFRKGRRGGTGRMAEGSETRHDPIGITDH